MASETPDVRANGSSNGAGIQQQDVLPFPFTGTIENVNVRYTS